MSSVPLVIFCVFTALRSSSLIPFNCSLVFLNILSVTYLIFINAPAEGLVKHSKLTNLGCTINLSKINVFILV